MGYNTNFSGQFNITPPLRSEHQKYLAQFSETRRMRRKNEIAEQLPDPVRLATDLPLGTESGYFVGGTGMCGQDRDSSILDYNQPPSGQPGLWCKWIPNENGTAIEWSGMEKFYSYTEWLQYLVEHFLAHWGYALNGEVSWEGENYSDQGVIYVNNNQIEAVPSEISNKGPSWK